MIAHNFKKTICHILLLSLCTIDASYALICPTAPATTVVPLASYDPPPLPGEPLMTIAGLQDYIKNNQIVNVSQLLKALPDRYKKNYALIKNTRGTGKSSLAFPRILLFGSDARLMFNVPTDPSDPDYERLDASYMNPQTGEWEFSQFDFTNNQQVLHDKPEACLACHGKPARPFWGHYLNWPGIMGDNPAPGDQAESLSLEDAQRFRELKVGLGRPERFNNLVWFSRYVAPEAQLLPNNRYGFALTITNNQIGYVMAESVFLRMKNKFPERYKALREEILLTGSTSMARLLTNPDKAQLTSLVKSLGGTGNSISDLMKTLGIDIANDLSLDTLPSEPANLRWNVGSGNLIGLVLELVLKDLADSDPAVRAVLEATPNAGGVYGIWECPWLGKNTWEVLEHRIFNGWALKGQARQQEHAVYYPVDANRVEQPFFQAPGVNLFNVLKKGISVSAP